MISHVTYKQTCNKIQVSHRELLIRGKKHGMSLLLMHIQNSYCKLSIEERRLNNSVRQQYMNEHHRVAMVGDERSVTPGGSYLMESAFFLLFRVNFASRHLTNRWQKER